MSFNRGIGERYDKRARVSASVFVIVLLTSLFLSLFHVFSDVKPIVSYGWGWWIANLVTMAVMFIAIGYAFRVQKINYTISGSLFKRLLGYSAGLLGLFLIANSALFSGVSIIFHHLDNEPGSIVGTVVSKQDSYSKYRCRPRLIIKEFTYWSDDYFCPGGDFYRKTFIGDKIKMSGLKSDYGIEIQWIKNLGNPVDENTMGFDTKDDLPYNINKLIYPDKL